MADRSAAIGRRSFLRRAGAFSGVLGVWGGLDSLLKYQTQLFLLRKAPLQSDTPQERWKGATVKEYRPLGRTGWRMSDISFGTSGLSDAGVLRLAIERGVNYIDTSPDYSESCSERLVGEAIRGRRDKLFVVSKFCTAEGHLPVDTAVADVIRAVESSLVRLRTDYIDLVHVHACNSVERLMAPNFHEAFDRLKEQGKARFMGVSSHTPLLETVMSEAVDSGRFDVIMVAYNFRSWPRLAAILARAQERGVGVVAMKTLKGAYHTVLKDFTPDERESFTQAAFKWVNNDPRVSGLVVTMRNAEQVDEYLFASGGKLDPADLLVLEKYDRLVAQQYCRPGCGDCLESCPAELPIDDVLRYSMYFENYGDERRARASYRKLRAVRTKARGPSEVSPLGGDTCVACSAPCEDACSFSLPIRSKMIKAHALMS
ncbi:MAG: aldo/keto reductase [Candidatus Binatia bacterium]